VLCAQDWDLRGALEREKEYTMGDLALLLDKTRQDNHLYHEIAACVYMTGTL
jgi:hypothetical protein